MHRKESTFRERLRDSLRYWGQSFMQGVRAVVNS